MYCRKCLYPLRGCPGRYCPECGKRFDPSRSKTYLKHPRKWWMPVTSSAGVALACVSALAFGVAVELYLATGSGDEAFGVWKPPNSGLFFLRMGVAALSSLALSLACCVFVLIRGPKWHRIAVLLILLIPCLVFSYAQQIISLR